MNLAAKRTQLLQYLREPEEHPRYEEEWRIFFIAQSRHLHRNDLVNRWIQYWPRRIVQLYNNEISQMNFDA
jgi:hypothetical protein